MTVLVTVFLTFYNRIIDMVLIDNARHISCTLWSENWLARLSSFDANALLGQYCLICKVAVKSCTIRHKRARMRFFATQETGKDEPVRCYYGTVV